MKIKMHTGCPALRTGNGVYMYTYICYKLVHETAAAVVKPRNILTVLKSENTDTIYMHIHVHVHVVYKLHPNTNTKYSSLENWDSGLVTWKIMCIAH